MSYSNIKEFNALGDNMTFEAPLKTHHEKVICFAMTCGFNYLD
jgi:hypothetical protein